MSLVSSSASFFDMKSFKGKDDNLEGMLMVSDEGLSIAAMHRICKKAGAERVSGSATKEMAEVLEVIGIKIGKEALGFAMHAGRKTVKGRDIKIASKKVLNL